MHTIVYLLIIIVLIVILISLINVIEYFGDELDIRKDNIDYVNITDQFPDIKKFDNDSDFRMGLDKCIEYKDQQKEKGNCVEYGITGNAWYYPPADYDFSHYREINKTSNQGINFNTKEVNKSDVRNVDEPINSNYHFVFR